MWINTNYVFGRPWDFFIGQSVIYDRFDFSFNLVNDTWSLDVFSGVNLSTMTLVTDRAFGQNLLNFTEIDWHVGYGNEKSFFDDSSFVVSPAPVPEPGSIVLLGLGISALVFLRRQRLGRVGRK